MSRAIANSQPARRPADGVDEAIARVGAMNVGELRSVWKETFGSEAPFAFSKDLLARAIAYRLQEEAYGGLKASTARLLRSMADRGGEPPRQVKVGSIIVREHRGVLHEVLVAPNGFCWQGQTFDSLSTIARKITGVSWNGPRFFGLRSKTSDSTEEGRSGGADAPPASQRAGVASRKTESGRSGRRSSIRTGMRP